MWSHFIFFIISRKRKRIDVQTDMVMADMIHFACHGFTRDPKRSFDCLSRLATNEEKPWAQYNMGVCYNEGLGVAVDEKTAVLWFHKAAGQKFTKAYYMLGWHYFNGRGVTKNYTVAVKWLQKGADDGDAEAQGFLGLCYKNGSGVEQNDQDAEKWMRKAAEQNDSIAQYHLAIYFTKAKQEAIDLLEKVAANGCQLAKQKLEQMKCTND